MKTTLITLILSIAPTLSFAGQSSKLPLSKTIAYADTFINGYQKLTARQGTLGELVDGSCELNSTASAVCRFEYDAGELYMYKNIFDVEVSYLDGMLGEVIYELSYRAENKK